MEDIRRRDYRVEGVAALRSERDWFDFAAIRRRGGRVSQKDSRDT